MLVGASFMVVTDSKDMGKWVLSIKYLRLYSHVFTV